MPQRTCAGAPGILGDSAAYAVGGSVAHTASPSGRVISFRASFPAIIIVIISHKIPPRLPLDAISPCNAAQSLLAVNHDISRPIILITTLQIFSITQIARKKIK